MIPQDYRKFLKNSNPGLEGLKDLIGSNIAQGISLKNNEMMDLSYLEKTSYGSLIFFTSEQCTSCDLEPVIEFSKCYEKFEFLVFYESEKELEFSPNTYIKLQKAEMDTINNIFGVSVIPAVLVLNNKGQIISAGVFNTIKDLEILSFPLLEVFYKEKNEGTYLR